MLVFDICCYLLFAFTLMNRRRDENLPARRGGRQFHYEALKTYFSL